MRWLRRWRQRRAERRHRKENLLLLAMDGPERATATRLYRTLRGNCFAHHSGPGRKETLEPLARVDAMALYEQLDVHLCPRCEAFPETDRRPKRVPGGGKWS